MTVKEFIDYLNNNSRPDHELEFRICDYDNYPKAELSNDCRIVNDVVFHEHGKSTFRTTIFLEIAKENNNE